MSNAMVSIYDGRPLTIRAVLKGIVLVTIGRALPHVLSPPSTKAMP